jgi:putative two-component system response regulator
MFSRDQNNGANMTFARQPVPDRPSQSPQPSPSHPSRNIRILCVDDDSLFRTLIRDILEGAGYTVLLASDGETGLNLARQEQPDLVLLDLVLPGPNGFDICAQFKSDPCVAHIPVLILTQVNNADLNPLAFDAGALFALQKTASPERLLDLVQTALEYVETSQTPSDSPGPPHALERPKADS